MVAARARRCDLLRAFAPAMALAALLGCIWGATDAVGLGLVPADKGPENRALELWDPSQSWPEGRRPDSRLDRPVHFWRAGVSLEELFVGIEEQTAVKCGFWPGGGDSARLRINLYLNPDDPPTLRDVMAQLMWVTGCSFACTAENEQAGPRSYYLMDTSLGRELVDALPEELRGRDQQVRRDVLRTREDLAAAVKDKLPELRDALKLSRDELIDRYRGVDDFLLLTLLDLQRRAGAEYVSAALADTESLESERDWPELSAEEQALLRTAFPPEPSWRPPPAPAPVRYSWDESAEMAVEIGGAGSGSLDVQVLKLFLIDDEGVENWLVIGGRSLVVLDVRELGRMGKAEILSLARHLGEEIPPGEEDEYCRRWAAAAWGAREKRRLEEGRHEARPPTSLSREMADRLSSLSVRFDPRRPYALWEVQEATAAASGLHVISDCFWQERRRLGERETPLDALRLSCEARPQESRGSIRRPRTREVWEWGDAGSFLRFRSENRALWRASLLPATALAQLDAYLEPYLPRPPEFGDGATTWSARLSLDLDEVIGIAQPLNDLQLEYGGRLTYEDPADPIGACRYGLREAVLRDAARDVDFFRLVASLTDEERQQALATGLSCTEFDQVQLQRFHNAVAGSGVDLRREPLAAWRLKLTMETFPRNAEGEAPPDGSSVEPTQVEQRWLRAAAENDFVWGQREADLSDALPGWRPGPKWGRCAAWQFGYHPAVRVHLPRAP